MNYIIAAIGANLTIGLVTGVTAATNGAYTMITNISKSTSTGVKEVKQIIEESDLEVKIKTIQLIINDINVNENTSLALQHCIKSIKDVINDISEELEKINNRIKYNDNLWVGSAIRAYGFHGASKRLNGHIKKLESRYKDLITLITLENSREKR
jgi:hypothetical protein